MSTFPDLCATMPLSRECRVTTFTSNIISLSKYSRILIESCLFLCCWAALQSLCWSLFQQTWTFEIIHWLQCIQGLTEAMWLTVLLSSIISLGVHIHLFGRLCPSLQVRGHFLHSLDLYDPISNPFRLYKSSQNVNPVYILHFEEGSSASPHGLLCKSLLSTSTGR